MPFFRRKTDKQKTSPQKIPPQKTHESSRNSRPPSVSSSTSSIGTLDASVLPDANLDPENFDDGSGLSGGRRPRTLLLRPDSELDAAAGEVGVPGNQLKPQTPMGTSSRLSKTLHEVLYDKDALAYFIQYMTSRDAEHIIKFWLDAGSFQASSWTRIRTHSLNKVNPTEKARAAGHPPSAPGGSCGNTGNCSPNITSPGHAGHTESETGRNSSSENSAIRRTGTAEANLNLLTHNTATSPTSIEAQASGDWDGSDVACTKSESDASSGLRFAEAGAHGTDPRCQCPQQTECDHTAAAAAAAAASSEQGSGSQHYDPALPSSSTASPSQKNTSQTDCSNNQQSKHVNTPPQCDTRQGNPNPSAQPTRSPLLDTTHETSFQEKLRKSIEKDAVNIYSKYISLDATHPIGITDVLRNEAISRICREDGQVDPQCFTGCQEFVVLLMEKDYFQGFLQSDFHCKHQIDILTGSQVQLADVLYNEAALFYFMEFMEQEGAIDLLQCWLAIDNFQQQLSSQHGKYDGLEAQNDAMVIYEKYFSLQATNPLGFDDSVRFEVECNICREGGPLPDCFVTAKRQVLRTIDKVYFPQFLTSDLYYKFLHELINTIHTANDMTGYRRKRAGSDASSEHSVGSKSVESESANNSTKNTLLAMDTSQHNIKKALTKINDDMRIDNTLLNPENLWQRPQAGKMSLGRINEVGQFISEFAPNPDTDNKKKASTSGASFFKRKKDEKTQEEMAIQIAQMIINDVSLATGSSEEQEDTES